MEQNRDPENGLMMEYSAPQAMQTDPERSRFPCCIVWTPLPVISWFIPFIGHMGICREDGVILDFAGPNFVCVDNFTFGAVARFIQISKEKCCVSPYTAAYRSLDGYKQNEPERGSITWDDALKRAHRNSNTYLTTCLLATATPL